MDSNATTLKYSILHNINYSANNLIQKLKPTINKID